MTTQVITEVSPSDEPFYASSVKFSVPNFNQTDPPPAKGLQAQDSSTILML